ncbi:transcription elongation factor SPT6 homolog isoform X1 [Gossypium arboreum]|uniref:transcription elongation factor SPT6 homolog isoform X1 n=1 Tax=Gossypium arboreum TaxID=29729 RepID=UPI00081916CC|nr:transcription elongation factor SPT6 homolog isoform X1 [Gossypium arboreum]
MNGGANTEEKLKCTLFGDDDGQPLEDIPEDEEQIEEEGDGDMGEEDKMADFIVEEDDVPGDSVRYNLCTAWICRSLYTLILESWSNLFCRWKKMKNKKSGHAFDVSPSALKGAQDIFGDVDELLQLRKQRLDYSDQKERRLEDKFEPTVLSEKYMTVKDDEIRTIDIPERIQIFEESTGSPPMDEESNWMHKQLTSSAILLFGKERTDLSINKDDVLRFLDLTHVQNLNPYYHEERSCVQSDQEKVCKEREMAKKPFMLRMIVHPCFQNITANEAIESLSDKDPGENIIRPSSRGPSFLTLTLKLCDGVYAHKDIVEGGKEHKDITNLLCIGKTLKIGEDTFEDLDEVMDRYVDPLVSHLKAMLSYRRFRKGTKGEVDELLRIEKSEYPMRIVYCFGISHEHPGTFILTYIRSSKPHHEYIRLYPKGFKFRKTMYEDIDRLVGYFQKHIDDPQHESGPL